MHSRDQVDERVDIVPFDVDEEYCSIKSYLCSEEFPVNLSKRDSLQRKCKKFVVKDGLLYHCTSKGMKEVDYLRHLHGAAKFPRRSNFS